MTSNSGSGKLKAGWAVIDITPPVGLELSGWAFGPSRGVLHPLGGHALFLDNGSVKMMLISADLIGFDTPYADAICSAIAGACGIGVESVMLAATHTHSGPATCFLRNWGERDPAYLEALKGLLVDVSRQAVEGAAPARMGSGLAYVPGIAINRTDPNGATDPEVGLLRFDDVGGRPRAVVMSCGCHPVNLHHHRNLITPDFPWFTRQWLKARLGDDLVVLHLSSPFGDQNPVNFDWSDPTEEQARASGERLAVGAFPALEAIETRDTAALQVLTDSVQLPLQPILKATDLQEHAAAARKKLAGMEAAGETGLADLAEARTEMEWAEEALALKRAGREQSQRDIALQAFRLGDALVVGLPAELYVSVGARIRSASPYGRTLIASQTNGVAGYVTTPEAFDACRYEATDAMKRYGVQLYEPGADSVLVDGVGKLLSRFPHQIRDAMKTRNPRSRELRRKAVELVVGGCQAHKAPRDLDLGMPAFVERAEGARFWDVDGNEYIDFLMSYGPIVLGHGYPAVDAAVIAQMKKGTIFDVEFPEMIALSEKLVELIPCAEMCAYFVGGSSATSGAVAIARSHTRREKIIRCGYHGWHAWTQAGSAACPQAYGQLTLTVPYDDLDALATLLEANRGEVAGMIIEAVQGKGPSDGYFDGVRQLADEHGVVFILDEVKTGFRFALGGAQQHFGIHPDIACFGKAMCNGYPGSVVVGERAVMAPRGDTWLAATFHADAVSVAAALATITELEARDGIGHQWRLGQRLIDGLDGIFQRAGVGLEVQGFPCLAAPRPVEAHYGRLYDRFLDCLIAEGVYMSGHPWFLCLAHAEADIDLTLEKAETALRKAMA